MTIHKRTRTIFLTRNDKSKITNAVVAQTIPVNDKNETNFNGKKG
jgi:hypothetical protein